MYIGASASMALKSVMIPDITPGSAHIKSVIEGCPVSCHGSWSPFQSPCPPCAVDWAMLWPMRCPSTKPIVSVSSSALKSWTTARRVLVSIRNTIVSDMLSFCRFCRVSFCTFESMLAPLESPFHRHALFQRRGASGTKGITEPIEYHRQRNDILNGKHGSMR